MVKRVGVNIRSRIEDTKYQIKSGLNKIGKSDEYKKAYDKGKEEPSDYWFEQKPLVPLRDITKMLKTMPATKFHVHFFSSVNLFKIEDLKGAVCVSNVDRSSDWIVVFKKTDSEKISDNLFLVKRSSDGWHSYRGYNRSLGDDGLLFNIFNSDMESNIDADFIPESEKGKYVCFGQVKIEDEHTHYYGTEDFGELFTQQSYEQKVSVAIQILSLFDIDKQTEEDKEIMYNIRDNAVAIIQKHLYDTKCECYKVVEKTSELPMDVDVKFYAEAIDKTKDMSLSEMLKYCEDECDKMEVKMESAKAKQKKKAEKELAKEHEMLRKKEEAKAKKEERKKQEQELKEKRAKEQEEEKQRKIKQEKRDRYKI